MKEDEIHITEKGTLSLINVQEQKMKEGNKTRTVFENYQ